jgi:hypothetical protein
MKPWLSIWTEPKETILAIVRENPAQKFALLSGLYGLPFLLNLAQSISLIDKVSLPAIVIGALILSVFVGMIAITITSWLVLWTGKWLGGTAPYSHIRAAVAWSNVPNFFNVLFWFGMIVYFGGISLSGKFVQFPFTPPELTVVTLIFLSQLALSVWSIVMLVNGLAAVQRYSSWKAFLNLVLALIVALVAVWILTAIFGPIAVQ